MKKIIALILVALLALTSIAAIAESNTGATEGVQSDAEFYAKADLGVLSGKKIGVTVQDLKNPYWAGVMSALQTILDEAGAEATILGADQDPLKQTTQIEQFATNGVDLIMAAPQLKPLIEKWNAMAPMGRLGQPEELMGIVVYLASDAASFTTGSDFVIDGAFTCF